MSFFMILLSAVFVAFAAVNIHWQKKKRDFIDRLESVDAIFLETDSELNNILYINSQIDRALGYSLQNGKGQPDSLQSYFHPDDHDWVLASFRNAIETGESDELDCRLIAADGKERWFKINLHTVTRKNKTLLRGLMFDITEKKEIENSLRESETKYRELFQNANDGIYLQEIREPGQPFRTIEVNDTACRMLGYSRQELLDLDIDLTDPDFEPTADHLADLYTKGRTTLEWVQVRKDGSKLPVEISGTLLKIDGKDMVLSVVRDITERKKAVEVIRFMAYHDPLTDLPNRMLFTSDLGTAIETAKRSKQQLAVLFLDLDNFKLINDSLGHPIGDLLLQQVAQRLQAHFPEKVTIARFGGDEFGILLENIEGPEQADGTAKQVQKILSEPFNLDQHEVFITTSIGISFYPEDGTNINSLIKNADTAMYRAKHDGKNRYKRFSSGMNTNSVTRITMETDLRKALAKMELEVYYQPRIDTINGYITGMEALLRWNHPELGMLPPSRFIPLAEETGLIVPIGEWVLREAIAQNKLWRNMGYNPGNIAVNLSARQFQQKNLTGMIGRALQDAGLDPKYLELEITENTLMHQIDDTMLILEDLKKMGIFISIDDFGTAYSSLNYLKRFPVDKLKIDRSFIKEVTSDERDAAITVSMIQLAHNLRLNVVAEGVETMEQLVFLRNQRCDEVQGYLFSVPVSAADVEKHLTEDKMVWG